MKRLILAAMEDPDPDHAPKGPEGNSAAFLSTLGLDQLCTKNTKRLFSTPGLSQTFLAMDPSEWDEEEAFQEALCIINGLAVVNDRAERGVALIQEFNKKLTSGEEQLQYLLQVVFNHRRKFPDCSKKTLMAAACAKE